MTGGNVKDQWIMMGEPTTGRPGVDMATWRWLSYVPADLRYDISVEAAGEATQWRRGSSITSMVASPSMWGNRRKERHRWRGEAEYN